MVSPPDRGNAELLRCGYKREIFDLNIHKGISVIFSEGIGLALEVFQQQQKMTQREKNGCFIYPKGKFTKKI